MQELCEGRRRNGARKPKAVSVAFAVLAVAAGSAFVPSGVAAAADGATASPTLTITRDCTTFSPPYHSASFTLTDFPPFTSGTAYMEGPFGGSATGPVTTNGAGFFEGPHVGSSVAGTWSFSFEWSEGVWATSLYVDCADPAGQASSSASSASPPSPPPEPPAGNPPAVVPPAIDALEVSPHTFATDPDGTWLGKLGAEIQLTLSVAATVRFHVRRDPPVQDGGPAPANPHVFRRRLGAGRQVVPFTGTLGKRTFAPGRYRLIARARDSAGTPSERVTTRFRISDR